MTRIFFSLATLSLVLLSAALVLGMSLGDFNQIAQEALDSTQEGPNSGKPIAPEIMNWAVVHKMTGVAAALLVVFVNSIVVTYFVGTSRWCREVVETYRLDPNLVRQSARLKHRTFPWAVLGMLTVVGVSALGAAADPATGRLVPGTLQLATAAWAPYHLVGSFAGVALIGWVYFVCWNNIYANHQVIEKVLARVRRVREEKGLETEETPQPESVEHGVD